MQQYCNQARKNEKMKRADCSVLWLPILCKRPIKSNPHPAYGSSTVGTVALPGLPRSTDSIPCTVTCAEYQTSNILDPRSSIYTRQHKSHFQERSSNFLYSLFNTVPFYPALLSKYLIRPVKSTEVPKSRPRTSSGPLLQSARNYYSTKYRLLYRNPLGSSDRSRHPQLNRC
jgi:hypothetical protein